MAEMKVLSEDAISFIQREPSTRNQKIERFLNMLPSTGPEGFRHFLDGLQKCDVGLHMLLTGTVTDAELVDTSLHPRMTIEIGQDRSVLVNTSVYKDVFTVNIRQYADGKPMKRGINLPLKRIRVLQLIAPMITQAVVAEPIQDKKYHLGRNQYVTVSGQFKNVDLRQYFHDPKGVAEDGMLPTLPTRSGISLRIPEWLRLCDVLTVLDMFVPEINSIETCDTSHSNQEGYYTCPECSPNFVGDDFQD
jgi:hypothetical protein